MWTWMTQPSIMFGVVQLLRWMFSGRQGAPAPVRIAVGQGADNCTPCKQVALNSTPSMHPPFDDGVEVQLVYACFVAALCEDWRLECGCSFGFNSFLQRYLQGHGSQSARGRRPL